MRVEDPSTGFLISELIGVGSEEARRAGRSSAGGSGLDLRRSRHDRRDQRRRTGQLAGLG